MYESYEVAKDNIDHNVDKVPMASCVVRLMNNQKTKKPFLVLFDSGSDTSWWSADALPKGCVPSVTNAVSSSTLSGPMMSNRKVTLEGVYFPEFFKTRYLHTMEARVFSTPCRYDAIIGRDVLQEMGITLDFKNQMMTWDDCRVEMRQFPLNGKKPTTSSRVSKDDPEEPSFAEQLFFEALEADLYDDDNNTLPTCDETECSEDEYDPDLDFDPGDDHVDFSLDDDEGQESADKDKDVFVEMNDLHDYEKTQELPLEPKRGLKDSKYERADIDAVVRSCSHLSLNHQNDLRQVLEERTKLFDNKLKKFAGDKIHLDLKPDAVPHATRAYTVPHNHLEVFKRELDRLVSIGVLEEGSRSEWISGTFIIPKKLLPGEDTPRVRWVSDF